MILTWKVLSNMKTFIHTHITVDNSPSGLVPVVLAIETRFAQYYKVFEMMGDEYCAYSPIAYD